MLNAWLMPPHTAKPASGLSGCRRVVHVSGVSRWAYSIVGMENSAPSLMPDGQREVTVLVRV
jgi:hypothetical protein